MNKKIDWARKLTSRKFWIAVATFVTLVVMHFTGDKEMATEIAQMIMAGAVVIAYIIGEGLADSGRIEYYEVNNKED